MKKKLVFLIILICFSTLIIGLHDTMIFGTEYSDIPSSFTFTIVEPAVNESLACNGYTGDFQQWDVKYGSSPYLDAIDDNDSHDAPGRAYIYEEKNANQNEGWFTFNNTNQKGGNLTVNLTFRASCIDGDGDGFCVYYDVTGSPSGFGTIGPLVQINSLTYVNITVTLPGTFRVTEVNNMHIYLKTTSDGGGDERWVDYVIMTIYRGPPIIT